MQTDSPTSASSEIHDILLLKKVKPPAKMHRMANEGESRKLRGPRLRSDLAPPVTAEVQELLRVSREQPPYAVGHWLAKYVDQKLDEELELLASHVLCMDVEPSEFTEVRSALTRGQEALALMLLVSRMRRRFSRMLRDHTRGSLDGKDDDALHYCATCQVALSTER